VTEDGEDTQFMGLGGREEGGACRGNLGRKVNIAEEGPRNIFELGERHRSKNGEEQ